MSPCDTHLCLLNGANLIEVRPLPSHRDRETAIFRCWLEQTGNSFGSLEFPQAGPLKGLHPRSEGHRRDVTWSF